MRKVLGMKTTYVARENTNKRVYEEANKKVKEQGGKKEIVTSRVAYEKAKQTKMRNVLGKRNPDLYNVTFSRNLTPWIYTGRRVGRPTDIWAIKALENVAGNQESKERI